MTAALTQNFCGHRRENRLDLGPHPERLAVAVHVDRLHAEPIARDQDPSAQRVDEHQPPHAVQPVEGVVAPLDERVKEDLGVAVGSELHAVLSLELLAQFEVVVDLAVEDQRVAAVGRHHRLIGGRPVGARPFDR